MSEELLGAEVDGWRVVLRLGQGATGAVYEARKGGRRAAIKIVRPDVTSPSTLARFQREARLLMGLDHPNVVGCYGAGESDGFAYVLLEFLGGGALDAYLRRVGHLSAPQIVWLARQLLAGLAEVHGRGIVHRDLKPANVLLDARGTPKLVDFNLARGEALPSDLNVTTDGTIIGTPYYMAPELVEGQEVGPRTDLYALGAMLYHLLLGSPPYEGSSSLAILQKHMTAEVPDPCAQDPEIPPQLGAALRTLLAKSPADRPASAAEALELFAGLDEAPLEVDGPGPARRRRPRRRGHGSGTWEGTASGVREATRAVPRPGQSTTRRRRRAGVSRTPSSERAGPDRSGEQEEATAPHDPERLPDAGAASPEGAWEGGSDLLDVPPPSRERFAEPEPLPVLRRSRLLDTAAALASAVALLHVADLVLRAEGQAPLDALAVRLGWFADPGTAEGDLARGLLGAIRRLFRFLDGHRLLWAGAVLFILLDRLLSVVLRVGPLGAFALRLRLVVNRGLGRAAAAARDLEFFDRRLEAGDLLSSAGLAAEAAEVYRRGGYRELEAEALVAAGKPKAAIEAYRQAGSESAPLHLARLGDPSVDSARLLAQRGLFDEAIAVHLRAGRRFEAAGLLEEQGRFAEAAELYAEGHALGAAREYWHAIGKQGSLDEAPARLARHAAGLFEREGAKARAAELYERARDFERAALLFEEAGDLRGRARCLLAGLPQRGPLDEAARARLLDAGAALEAAGDPEGIPLLLRAGETARAAELAERLPDFPQAAELFARAGQPARGARCALKAGNRRLAAKLHEEAGEFGAAKVLYEELGAHAEAAACAERARATQTASRRVPRSRRGPAASGASRRPRRGARGASRARPSLAGVEDPAELVGEALGSWRLKELVEAGRSVWTYRAAPAEAGPRARLWVVCPRLATTPEACSDFVRVVRASVGCSGPHLLETVAADCARGLCFVVGEDSSAPTLEGVAAAEAPLSPARAARLGVGLLRGLSRAHTQGLAHLGLTPARVHAATDGGARVEGLGLWNWLVSSAGPREVLDPRYAAPEQARGEAGDAASDQYAAASILYKLLTARLPHSSKTPEGFWALHAGDARPLPLGQLRPDLPPLLRDVIMRGLAKSPRRRHASARAFERALAPFAGRGAPRP
ncbi:MAG: hypothetical protein D6731_12070 [Planctomycetota bacterium]|nr:MAG: hypothetical protein D6731_12070 [Planctomycetota bacterium]